MPSDQGARGISGRKVPLTRAHAVNYAIRETAVRAESATDQGARLRMRPLCAPVRAPNGGGRTTAHAPVGRAYPRACEGRP